MSKVFTKQISNTSFALETTDGIKYMSIKNNSASAQEIVITGTLVVNGVASGAIRLAQGDIVTIASDTPLDGVTITSASATALADLIATQ